MLSSASLRGVKDFPLPKNRSGRILITDEFAKIHSNVDVVYDVSDGSVSICRTCFPDFLCIVFYGSSRWDNDGEGTQF